MIAFLAIISQSCSNSNSQSNESEGICEEESHIDPVFVWYTGALGGYHKVAFKVNGQYVMFDNDADYQELCQYTYFLMRAMHEIARNGEEFGFSDKEEEWVESPEFTLLLKDLPEIVGLYFSGNKSKVEDKCILNKLERIWYDEHPDRLDFHLINDHYGYKGYVAYYGHASFGVGFSNNEDTHVKDLDGNDLPDGILVAIQY